MSRAWITALRSEDLENWEICKAHKLWGTPRSGGEHVEQGDELFVWQAGSGLLARCIATSDADHPSASRPAPWPDGVIYEWIFDIEVAEQADPPKQLSFPGGRNNERDC